MRTLPDLPPNDYTLGKFVPGFGNLGAKLIIVGEAPGKDEEYERTPFVGESGKLLEEMLNIAGLSFNDVYRTNIEKYRPPENKLALFKLINKYPGQDINLLWEEIETIQRNGGAWAILALGNHALQWTTGKVGIKKWRGSILPNKKFGVSPKVISTYHPAALLRSQSEETKVFSYSWRAFIQLDYNRAVQESQVRELNLPARRLEYAKSSNQASRFFNQYRDHNKAVVDIETKFGIPFCIGIAFSQHHGMCFPLYNIDGFEMDRKEQAYIHLMLAQLFEREDMHWINQHLKFDWRKILRFGFRIRGKFYWDTGIANHTLYPEFPKRLEFLTSIWTREPYYKDELKEYNPKRDKITDVFLYNAKDVCVPFEIYLKQYAEMQKRNLLDYFLTYKMPLAPIYMAMEDRGFGFDPEINKILKVKYLEKVETIQARLEALLGFRPELNSPKKIKKLLFQDLGLPSKNDTNEDTLVALLPSIRNEEHREILDLIIDGRKNLRTISNYINCQPDYDGKMRTLFNLNGAASMRRACNILKQPERPTKLGMQFQNLTKHGSIGPDIRKELIPSE